MRQSHVRPSKDLLCSLCGKKVRWAADAARYGVRLKRYAHRQCLAAAASSEAAKPIPFPIDYPGSVVLISNSTSRSFCLSKASATKYQVPVLGMVRLNSKVVRSYSSKI